MSINRSLRSLLVLSATAALLLPAVAASASEPGDSTLTAPKKTGTVTTTFTSSIQGTGSLDAAIPCSTLQCDTHTVTLQVPATYWKKRGGELKVDIAWTGPENDLDLYVYDAAGTEIATSGQSLTEAESVTVPTPAAGAYTIEIRSFLAAPGTEVTGTVSLVSTKK